jgi:hypothetical protein
LTLSGQANLRYVFEASTNLTRWTKIAVRTNLTETVELADGAAAKLPERFSLPRPPGCIGSGTFGVLPDNTPSVVPNRIP